MSKEQKRGLFLAGLYIIGFCLCLLVFLAMSGYIVNEFVINGVQELNQP